MAVQGVLANRLRSLLTMLGITIGVAAVIILVAVGHGSSVAVQQQIEALGTNIVTIQPGGFGFGRGSGGRAELVHAVHAEGRQGAARTRARRPTSSRSRRSSTATSPRPSAPRATRPASSSARRRRTPKRGSRRSKPARSSPRRTRSEHARVVVLGQTVVTNLFGCAEPARADDQAERHRLHGRRRPHVEGHERHPGPGRHRHRSADDHAGPAHRRQQRPEPDHRPGEVRARRRTRPRPRRPTILTPTHSIERHRRTSACSTRRRCCRRRRRRTTSSPCCSPRSPRSRCSSAGSA